MKVNQNINEELKALLPKKLSIVFDYLKSYDFVYKAMYNSKMSGLYDDLIENRSSYETIFSALGYSLNYGNGYVHVVARLNQVQNLERARKAIAYLNIITLCSTNNCIVRNNELLPGKTFNIDSINETIRHNSAIMNYLQTAEKKEGVGDLDTVYRDNELINKTVKDMVSIGLLECNANESIYTITPVCSYYSDLANQIYELVK